MTTALSDLAYTRYTTIAAAAAVYEVSAVTLSKRRRG